MLRRRDPSAIFRSVVLLSAVGTACGGAVETVGGYPAESTPAKEPETTGGGSSSGRTGSSGGSTSSSGFTGSSGGGSTSSSGGGSTSSSGGSTSSSGGTSTSSSGGGSTSSSGGVWTCKTGNAAMTDSYCCPQGQTCPWSGGGDGVDGGCALDCKAVCADVAPGVQGGFDGCWGDGDGGVSYYCGACGVGRLPNDTKPCVVGETVAEHLARQAYYEGVSVVAFERLAAVLVANGAPEDLIARARRAAEDEARHARIFADLAREHGASVPEIRLASREHTMFELALENATEGCVRETLGAAITLHQSQHAASDDVRAAFAAICEDEAEHAAFSWDLKAWFDAHLGHEERARIDDAHRSALMSARAATNEAPDATGLALGLPSPARTRRMLDLAIEAMAA